MKKFSEAQEQAKNGPKSAPDQESSSEEPKLGPHQNGPRAGSGKEGCSEEPKSGPHQNGPQPCSTKEGSSEEPRSDPQQNGAQTGSSEEAASDGPGSGRQQQDPDTRETQSKDEPAEGVIQILSQIPAHNVAVIPSGTNSSKINYLLELQLAMYDM